MSRGRRKKNSTPLAGSARTSSRESARCRYPASRSIALAGSDSDPLLGTATRSTGPTSRTGEFLQVSVDVIQRQSGRQHQHLDVVEQLRDLLRRSLRALVLGGHPRLGGLLDDLLADRV